MIDKSILLNLFETDEMVHKFLSMMILEIPKSIDELESFVLKGDLENATFSAHTLKSHFKYLGHVALSELGQQIENNCDNPESSSKTYILNLVGDVKVKSLPLISEIQEIIA